MLAYDRLLTYCSHREVSSARGMTRLLFFFFFFFQKMEGYRRIKKENEYSFNFCA